MDERHQVDGGFRAGHHGVWSARIVESTAMARGVVDGDRWVDDRIASGHVVVTTALSGDLERNG